MANSKYAPTQWQSDRFDIECPSGQLCLARKLQMDDVVALGLIDELDVFTEFASTMGDSRQKSDEEMAKEFSSNPKAFNRIIDIVDRVVSQVVIEPKIHLPYSIDKKGKRVELADKDIDSDVIYTNYVNFEDKMHIFNVVFQGDTIEQFRDGADEAV